MKNSIRCILPALLLCTMASSALADHGTFSHETLADMGLSSIEVLTDSDAMQIRGKNYRSGRKVKVWGNSSANVNSRYGEASSENGYEAKGKHRADGENRSYASMKVTKKRSKSYRGSSKGHRKRGHKKSSSKSVRVKLKAGGSSSAHAH